MHPDQYSYTHFQPFSNIYLLQTPHIYVYNKHFRDRPTMCVCAYIPRRAYCPSHSHTTEGIFKHISLQIIITLQRTNEKKTREKRTAPHSRTAYTFTHKYHHPQPTPFRDIGSCSMSIFGYTLTVYKP